MSLVLHIPGLSGTTDTIGNSYSSNSISDYDSSNVPTVGTISDTSSPYGVALAFQGSGNVLFNYTPKLNKTTKLSLTFWVKNDSSLGTTTFQPLVILQTYNSSLTTTNFRLERATSAGRFDFYNNGTFTGDSGLDGFDMPVGEWRFVALTVDTMTFEYREYIYDPQTDTVILDIHGTSSGTTQSYFLDTFTLRKTSQLTCSFMDVRIYNHILSTLEIKELLKRPVLHYPFDIYGGG